MYSNLGNQRQKCYTEGHGRKGVSLFNYYIAFSMCFIYISSFSIGRSSGYKASELSGLVEGSSLIVGGKEIEVCMTVCMCCSEALSSVIYACLFCRPNF